MITIFNLYIQFKIGYGMDTTMNDFFYYLYLKKGFTLLCYNLYWEEMWAGNIYIIAHFSPPLVSENP